MIDLSKIEHIVTHNGVFHADECFAIAFLNIATGRHPANEDLFDVIRVNNTDVEQYKDREDCIIIDIGDGDRFRAVLGVNVSYGSNGMFRKVFIIA